MPYSGIKATVLVVRRDGVTQHVRMADAESLFVKQKDKPKTTIQDDQLTAFVRGLRSPQPDQHCWDVDTASLSEVDWDLTPKRRDRSGLLKVMDLLGKEIKVAALRSSCRILSGRSVKSDQLVDEPPLRFSAMGQQRLFEEDDEYQRSLFDVPLIPYIRIKDIRHGQASKGSAWLSREAASAMDGKWKLKAGDVLLSKSGTIGKTGVVRNGGVGAVAAGGMFILRPDLNRLDPRFLSAYLSSHECRAWLDDKARGATIRHLTKRVLEVLPLPLPPLQIQQRAADRYHEHGTDVLDYLTQLLVVGEDDPVSEWLDGALRYLTSEDRTGLQDADITPLMHSQVFGRVFTGIHNRLVHTDGRKNSLAAWVLALAHAADALHNSEEVPAGPAFYGLLQQAGLALSRSEGLLAGGLPTENRARELTRIIARRVDHAMSALAGDIRVTISCDTVTLAAGEKITVEIGITNQGALPLRDVYLFTQPDWGGGKIGYLPEHESKQVFISGITHRKSAQFSLRVHWAGTTFDGQKVEGESEIAFDPGIGPVSV